MMSLQHENRIKEIEEKERNILNTLQNTMKLNTSLMQDLSKKSEALTNKLIPRNPIAPKNKKYPTHSEFGYKPQPSSKYTELFMSKKNGSSLSKRHRNRNSVVGGSQFDTLTLDEHGMIAGYPS